MITAQAAADYFLSRCDDEAGEGISNLKLQKLLYYAQGIHLAIYGVSLFNDKIVAWAHGPVVVDLYHKYRSYESNPIPPPEDINFDDYDTATREALDEAYTVFGQFSAWKLRSMTHSEPPWKSTMQGVVISTKKIKDYFDTIVTKDDEENQSE